MKTTRFFTCAVFLALALIAVSSGSARAQQAVGESASTEIRDTVVDPRVVSDAVPAMSVYWGGRYYRPWARPYAWRPYRYGGYWAAYRVPRCWWNGCRWICRPKRVLMY